MAFFGLTQIGYQNRVRQYTLRPDYTTEQWMRREQKPGGTDITPLPPIAGYVPPRRSIVPKSQTSGYGAGPGVQGEESWKEHMRLRFKHCRNPKGKSLKDSQEFCSKVTCDKYRRKQISLYILMYCWSGGQKYCNKACIERTLDTQLLCYIFPPTGHRLFLGQLWY